MPRGQTWDRSRSFVDVPFGFSVHAFGFAGRVTAHGPGIRPAENESMGFLRSGKGDQEIPGLCFAPRNRFGFTVCPRNAGHTPHLYRRTRRETSHFQCFSTSPSAVGLILAGAGQPAGGHWVHRKTVQSWFRAFKKCVRNLRSCTQNCAEHWPRADRHSCLPRNPDDTLGKGPN